MAWSLAVLWFDVFRIRRKVAIENIQSCFPDWVEKKVISAARESLSHMARSIVEFCVLASITSKKLDESVDFKGLEYLDEAFRQNRGVFLLGLHLSNGDFGIAALSNKGYKVRLISKNFTFKWLDQIWFKVRGRFGTKFIAPRNSSYEILKALKNKEAVIFVLDQFMGPPLGIRTQFFGRETGTAMGLALFAEKTRAPVVPCFAHLQKNGRYEVCFESPIPFEEQNDKKLNLKCMTQKYTDKIEEIIKRYPEQWMWIHRRWKAFNET